MRVVVMPSPFGGGVGAGVPFVWDDERSFPPTFAPGRNVVTTRYAKTTLPAPDRVDMGAELAKVRRILTALRAEDAVLIDIALDEARHQLAKAQPRVDRIGAAVQRALDFASRDESFADRREALTPPLRHICAWLGGPWYRLLGFVGLTF
jgi:hypothetical protein